MGARLQSTPADGRGPPRIRATARTKPSTGDYHNNSISVPATPHRSGRCGSRSLNAGGDENNGIGLLLHVQSQYDYRRMENPMAESVSPITPGPPGLGTGTPLRVVHS